MKSRGRLRTRHLRYVSAYLPGGISVNTALTAVAIGLWSDALVKDRNTLLSRKRYAQESWRQARSELESFLKEQPDNYGLIGDMALTSMALGDKAAALALAQKATATSPLEKDALDGSSALEFLARVSAQAGSPTALSRQFKNCSRYQAAVYLCGHPAYARVAPARSDVRSASE